LESSAFIVELGGCGWLNELILGGNLLFSGRYCQGQLTANGVFHGRKIRSTVEKRELSIRLPRHGLEVGGFG
jgi:hypothetical protein